MPSQHVDFRVPHISAQNQGSGDQHTVKDGNLNANTGGGTQNNEYNDHRTFHTMVLSLKGGMPSVWSLNQALSEQDSVASKPTRDAVIEWLSSAPDLAPTDNARHFDELSTMLTKGTGEWILATKQYRQWKDDFSSYRLLLIYGKLGSGKTMLVLRIIQAIKAEIKKQKDVACIYLYFHESHDEPLSVSRIWSSLLKQLLEQANHDKLAPDLVNKFDKSLQGSSPLRSADCLTLFVAQSATFKTIYLTIDGLDNCHNSEQTNIRQIERDIIKKLPRNTRALFTSRNIPLADAIDVSHTLGIIPRSHDIEAYVKSRLDDDVGLKNVLEGSEARNNVVKRVTQLTLESEMSDSSSVIWQILSRLEIILSEYRFLLARLHLDDLGKKRTVADINDALGQLPANLSDAFKVSIEHIKQHSEFERGLAKHILTWVVYAKAPLKVELLQESFAVQRRKSPNYRDYRPPESSVINVCSGLVVCDQETATLRLVHDSVQENLKKANVIPGDASLHIAKICLEYLLMDDPDKNSSLLAYASNHWYSHLGGDCHLADAETRALIESFLKSRSKLERAFRAMADTHDRVLDGMTGLHAAVFLNLRSWVEPLVEGGVSVNAECVDGQTAAHWAVIYGRRHILSSLISKSADLDVRDSNNETPLHKALVGRIQNLVPIVAILAKGRARVDIRGRRGFTAMASAIDYGPTSIAEILIVSLEDIDAEISKGWTSLREVIYHAHGHRLVDKLKAKDSKNSPSSTRSAPLKDAFQNHARRLIDLLLVKGANLNKPTSDGWLPLIHAVETGSYLTLRKLLERQPCPADPNLKDRNKKLSPLQLAFTYPNPKIINLLLDHKADINERSKGGWNPLIAAVQLGNRSLVWKLITMGAQLDVQDDNGESALHHALSNKHRDIAWLLIAHGADAKLSNKRYPSLIHLAIELDDLPIAWLLRQYGTDPDTPYDDDDTLLHQEVTRNNISNVRFLLDIGANNLAKDRTGCTPLHRAVIAGSEGAVAVVASRLPPAWLNGLDHKGNCALVLAVLQRNKIILQILLRLNADREVENYKGLIALHYAASLGFNDGIHLLMRNADDVNYPDREGYTAVHHAVRGDEADEKTLEILDSGGANLEARERNDMTPLMLAVQLGKESAVRQLLALGVDLHARHPDGWTAIDLAKDRGDSQMVTILERVWGKRPARR